RRGVRADLAAGRPAACRNGLGTVRRAHARRAGRVGAVQADLGGDARRRASRLQAADEVRAPRRAARARHGGSVLQARAARPLSLAAPGAAQAAAGSDGDHALAVDLTCARAAQMATSTEGMPIAAVHAKKTP